MQATLDHLKNLKNGATLFGKFYPTDYLVAVFRTPNACQSALDALSGAGFSGDDVLVTDGETIQAHQAEIFENRGFLDSFLGLFSDKDRFAKDVQAVSERSGARFVLIYAPNEELTNRASAAVSPYAALAQKYTKLGFHQIPVGPNVPHEPAVSPDLP